MMRVRSWVHSRSWRYLGFKLAKGYPCGYDAETGIAWWTGSRDSRLFIPRKGLHTIHAFCPEVLCDVTGHGATHEEAVADFNRMFDYLLALKEGRGNEW